MCLFDGNLIIEKIRVLKVQKYTLLFLAPKSLDESVTYGELNGTNRENKSGWNPLITNQPQQEIIQAQTYARKKAGDGQKFLRSVSNRKKAFIHWFYLLLTWIIVFGSIFFVVLDF